MRKALKIFLYFLGGVFVLLILAVVWLNTGWGKQFVKDRALAFLRGKLKTEVQIGELGYGLPKYVVLKDVLFKDQANDTLLQVGNLRININMLQLISSKIDVQSLTLDGVHAHIYRNAPDTNFNFTYIINAFAGNKPKTPKPEKEKDTSGSGLSIDVNKVSFSDIHARFDDYTGGTRLAVDLSSLLLKMKKIDLEEMDFRIKELAVKGLQTTFLQDSSYLPENPDTSTGATSLKLAADDIDLQDIYFRFDDKVSKFLMDVKLGQLKAEAKEFDLAREFVDIKSLSLKESSVKILMGKTSSVTEKAKEAIDTLDKTNWKVLAGKLELEQVNFVMDDENSPRLAQGIDYSHLDIRNLALNTEDILYSIDSISGNIRHLAVQEKSGLDLKELKTKFAYYATGAYLHDLYLETSDSRLQDHIEIHYPSLEALKTRMGEMQLDINLEKSVVGLRDVLIFAPDLREQGLFKKYGNEQLQLATTLTGRMDAINIENFSLAGLQNTRVNINGKLNGLPESNKLNYNLNILKLQSTNRDINALVLPQALEQIRVPDNFNAVGQVSGTVHDYRTNLLVMSSDGAAKLKGYVYMSPGKGNEKYDMFVSTDKLNIGRILKKDSTIGIVTANISAKGKSFDVKKMEAMLDGEIQSAGFMGYNYNNINFQGSVADKNGNLSLVSDDPNLRLQLDGTADLAPDAPNIHVKLNIDSADLQALKLYKDEMRIRALILADVDNADADYPSGMVVIDRPTVVARGERYFLDTLKISSKPNADSGQYIVVEADVLQALITGKTPLSQIGNIIQSHINRHYSFDSIARKDTLVATTSQDTSIKTPNDYSLNLQATIKDRPLLYALVPALKSMDTIRINAGIRPRTMFLNLDAPHVVINDMSIDSVKVRVNENDSTLSYLAMVGKLNNPSIQLWNTTAKGDIRGNKITADIRIADSARQDRFALNAEYHQHPDRQELHIKEGLKLNYKDWQVAQPNAVVMGKEGIYVQNLKISSGAESININSETQQFSSPMTVAINDFLISNITEIVQKDTLLANGLVNSNITIQNLTKNPAIKGNLTIKDLSIFNDTIGNLDLNLEEASANKATANVAVTGRGNDIKISGSYYPQPVGGNNFDLSIDVNALNLKSMEGVAMNQIKNTSGYIRGNLKITGTPAAPVIVGELKTDQLITTPTAVGAEFKMPSEKIQFTADGIEFENFKLVDSFGNKAAIDGKIITKDLKNITLALRIRARKWQALNSTANDNELFYGKLVLSTDLNVNGSTSSPRVDGNLTIHDTTKFTVAIPKADPGIADREGIIVFVDKSDPGKYDKLQPKADSAPKMALKTGAALNVNVAVEKNAEFNVIIDKSTGDFLRVRGEANLNTSVNPDGTIGLTGTYELNQGAYQLNYNLIKRRFDIQKGSTITFAGDPLEAEADIVAVYTANIPPYDLVEQQVDQSQLNYYKQRLPFNVQLKLKGPLLEPEVTFDIVLPKEKNFRANSEVISLVEGKLAEMRTNPSELNKQVFAVLVLNRFVAENPFESGTSTDAEFIARQSASRFLSEQFNQLADQFIKGFELNLDLESSEDYTTGDKRNRTDLNVSASKRLLDDRLTITVGNNFELEGQTQNTSQNTSLVPGNLAADYQLSTDGRYSVRVYRQNEIENVLEGYTVETGVSFIVNLEYNRFRNLFINRKRYKGDIDNKKEKSAGTGN